LPAPQDDGTACSDPSFLPIAKKTQSWSRWLIFRDGIAGLGYRHLGCVFWMTNRLGQFDGQFRISDADASAVRNNHSFDYFTIEHASI